MLSLPRKLATLALSVAAAGLSLAVIPAEASPQRARVTARNVVDEGSFVVETIELALPAAPTGADGRVAFSTAEGGSEIALANAPEMLVVETDATDAVLALRSKNAGEWSEWVDVAIETEDAPDGLPGEEGSGPANAVAGPIWIGDDAESVEVRVVAGAPTALRLEALTSNDQRPADPARAVTDGRPTMNLREAWTTGGWAFDNEGCEDGPQTAENIRAVVVHHTVNTNSYAASQVDDLLRGIYRFHTVNRGWCDIAYNFVVDRFGGIWEARTDSADDPVIGGHVKGFNTWTVGVALLGQHQRGASPAAVSPSRESLTAVQAVARWKLALHGVDPAGLAWLKNRSTTGPQRHAPGAWVQVPAIVSHHELGVTSCPGTLTTPSVAPMLAPLLDAHRASPPPVPGDRRPEHGPALVTLDTAGGLRFGGSASPVRSISLPQGAEVTAIDGRNGAGQVLLSNGSLVAFGGAPSTSARPAGSRQVVDWSAGTDGGRGWVLEEDGRIYHFGGATDRTAPVKPVVGQALRLAMTPDGRGYVMDRAGGLFPIRGTPAASIGRSVDAIDVALRTPSSGWVLDRSGRLHSFGGAPPWQPETAVASPRAIVTGGEYGGWILDAEGRYIRFGQERRAGALSTTVGVPTAFDAAVIGWDYGADVDDVKYADALLTNFLGRDALAVEADHYGARLDEESTAIIVEELATSDAWAGAILREMYRDVLGRDPDPDGSRFWLAQLRNGFRTQDLGAAFYGSPEYFESSGSTRGYVRRLYRELLGREPDAQGLASWVEAIESGRLSLTGVTLGFYQSPESKERRVRGLYQEFLGRAPDPEGLVFWSDQLDRIDDIRLAMELAGSEEYYDRVTE